MPAAKGGSSRRREPGRDKAVRLIPQAITEGRGAQWLSKASGVSLQVSCDLLATASQKVHADVDRQLGVVGGKLREAANRAVPVAITLQERSLSLCSRLLDRLELDIQEYQSIQGKDGDRPASVELAKAAKTLAGAVATLGASIKDLTGLKAAERVAVIEGGQAAKAKVNQRELDAGAVDVEVIFPE